MINMTSQTVIIATSQVTYVSYVCHMYEVTHMIQPSNSQTYSHLGGALHTGYVTRVARPTTLPWAARVATVKAVAVKAVAARAEMIKKLWLRFLRKK